MIWNRIDFIAGWMIGFGVVLITIAIVRISTVENGALFFGIACALAGMIIFLVGSGRTNDRNEGRHGD